jgi:hypothetical protein
MCFVEIKHHNTPLLGPSQHRSDVWAPSIELSGGVAQVQTTVQAAIESIGHKLLPTDKDGNPTGETIFNIEPRSCLVVGSFSQFQSEHGINVAKFRSFELYRQHMWCPEIITFDELFERARFIVEHGSELTKAARKEAN